MEGTSSPLGELFDHGIFVGSYGKGLMIGIDSLNCPLAGIVMVAACGYGSTPLGLFTVIIPCAPMFLSSWEQYHTGVLYLGYFNGPCEGIIIACTIMGFAAAYGPGFYHQRAIDAIGWPITDESIMMYDLFVWMCLIALFTIQVPSWSSLPTSHLSFADEQCVQRICREEKPWASVTSNSTSIGPHYTFLCSTLRLVTQSIFSRPREWKSNARRSHNDLCLWQNDHQDHPRTFPLFSH